ncbi:MAG: pseudouridine synthase [Anaerolineae bacterium]
MPTLAFYKPYGVISQFTAHHERQITLAAFVDVPGVYPAGRLDLDSEGLLLLTDDGALQARITDPRHRLPKVYLAQVERIPTPEVLCQLEQGVVIAGRRTRPVRAELLADEPDLPPRDPPIRFRKTVPTAWVRLTLHEGRNRQVRRMTAAVGHPTLRLVRTAIGPITLAGLEPGRWRTLTAGEVEELWRAVGSR